MTRTMNVRIAGITYLFYIAVAFPSMILFDRATKAHGTAAKLVRLAEHATDIRVVIVLSLLSCFAALVLAVTLYRVTCDEDRDIAMLAMTFRFGEGILGAIFILVALALLWLATTGGVNVDAAHALSAILLKVQGWNTILGATFFAAGSTLFSWLLLRGRMIPVPLAWLGVVASVLIVTALPLQLAGFFGGPFFMIIWLPMAIFELVLGPWLLFKGAAMAGGDKTI